MTALVQVVQVVQPVVAKMFDPAPPLKWFNVQGGTGGNSGSTIGITGFIHPLKTSRKKRGGSTLVPQRFYHLYHYNHYLRFTPECFVYINSIICKFLKAKNHAFTCLTVDKKSTLTTANKLAEPTNRSTQPCSTCIGGLVCVLNNTALHGLCVGSRILQLLKPSLKTKYKQVRKIKIVKLLFSIKFFINRKSAHPLKSHR